MNKNNPSQTSCHTLDYQGKTYVMVTANYAAGGNAKISLLKDLENKEFVLKSISIKNKSDIKRVKRFLREIALVEQIQDEIHGIVPIISKNIPKEIEDGNLENTESVKNLSVTYLMERAIPLEEKLENSNLIEIIECVISLSQTLSVLHKREIVHRDIKPSNLYYHKDYWCFADFGLVTYPKTDDLTKTGDRIGNYATIAPEMRFINNEVRDYRPADVYSLAKTLWMLITKKYKKCFDGIYTKDDKKISLQSFYEEIPLAPLENTLIKATCNSPTERINIDTFLCELQNYKTILLDNKKIITSSELRKKQSETNNNFIYNSADISCNTEKLKLNFYVNELSYEQKFDEMGLLEEIKVLKYIKMLLEKSKKYNYLVSPILEHNRNSNIPRLDVFVEYTATESKFVAWVFCTEDSVDFVGSRIYVANNIFIQDGENRTINYERLKGIVSKIEEIAYQAHDSENAEQV